MEKAVMHRVESDALREKMTAELDAGRYECLICVDTIKVEAETWACGTCHVVMHLSCLKEWVERTACDGGWQCPHCQHVYLEPLRSLIYKCFCGKTQRPTASAYATPHTCEKLCGKIRKGTPCPHACQDPCHPGPCRPCPLRSPEKQCHCGKLAYVTACSEKDDGRSCGELCNKVLSCGQHRCEAVCHPGPCEPCGEEYPQRCFCGRVDGEERPCATAQEGPSGTLGTFSCKDRCGHRLGCGNHSCTLVCHAGECPPCPTDPAFLKTCACGKTPLTMLSAPARKSCQDPVPVCKNVCGKPLACGKHTCTRTCHEGPCGPCQAPTSLECRCGGKRVMVTCEDARAPAGTVVQTIVAAVEKKKEFDIFAGGGKKKGKGGGGKKPQGGGAVSEAITLPLTCATRCRDQKTCRKHTCDQVCCPLRGKEHLCTIPCGKPLSCGLHRCERLCHLGRCPPCLESSFTELECACGATAIEPPVPCGTPPPACPLQCRIPRPCGHAANHQCHFGDCPPCTEMVIKNCASHGTPCAWLVPCHLKEVTCKQRCGKKLVCGKHVCQRPCHVGACSPCGRQCEEKLAGCGHPCGQPCHNGPCSPCTRSAILECSCGKNTRLVTCGMRHEELIECSECSGASSSSASSSSSSS